MRIRINNQNINTLEYLNSVYLGKWRQGYEGAVNRFRVMMRKLPQAEKVLDIGCAGGDFIKFYKEKYPFSHCYGIDISSIVIEQAQLFCPQGQFMVGDVYKLPFDDFDLIHCGELLEHLEEPEKAISEMYRVLKKGGKLVITTPNEKAGEYEEHIWKWDLVGVKELLKDFKILEEIPYFDNGHCMYIEAKK